MNKVQNFKEKLPNLLTNLRIVLIPFFVAAFYLEKGELKQISCIIFLIAAISDFFDGYLSRLWNVSSRYGAMLDPIADKLIVVTALCLIITEESWLSIPAILIICREIFISGLREFLGKDGNFEMPVTNLAKWKTASQMVSITLLILTSGFIANPTVLINVLYCLGCTIFIVSVGLTLYTGYQYYKSAKDQNLV